MNLTIQTPRQRFSPLSPWISPLVTANLTFAGHELSPLRQRISPYIAKSLIYRYSDFCCLLVCSFFYVYNDKQTGG
jgi:hypothetical protein